MNIKEVMNKLDIYIKGYSELLQENKLLKERLDMYDTIVETSTMSVRDALVKVKRAEVRLEVYKENIDIIFDGLNSILESMIKKENVSLEEIKQLKIGIEKIKDNLNEPTNE